MLTAASDNQPEIIKKPPIGAIAPSQGVSVMTSKKSEEEKTQVPLNSKMIVHFKGILKT